MICESLNNGTFCEKKMKTVTCEDCKNCSEMKETLNENKQIIID